KMLGINCAPHCREQNDLEDSRQVETGTAEEYAKSVGATHFHTSAKDNTGIDELFLELTRQMISSAGNSNRTQIKVDAALPPPKKTYFFLFGIAAMNLVHPKGLRGKVNKNYIPIEGSPKL
ncbi:Ras-related protein Rab-21, partial [Caligus rogercresseyi]